MHHGQPARCLCFVTSLLLLLLTGTALAAPPQTADHSTPTTGTLTVGVKVAPPFVTADGQGGFDGLAIDLWQKVAKDNGWKFRYRQYDLKGLLDAVRDGDADVGLGAITTTAARQESMDFTHPITSSGLGVAVRGEQHSGWLAVARALVSAAFLKVIGLLVLLLLIVGFLVWLFEHEKNPEQFGGTRPEGIFSGFWWAMVTMTTVGYGDTAPRSVPGRVLGLVWMLTALIVVSFFTASITSALTVGQLSQRIASANDLDGMRIASIPDSTSAQWLTGQHWAYTRSDKLEDALQELAAGRVDAVVYDKPLMQWMVHRQFRGKLDVLPLVLERQDYAFALPRHSPLRRAINASLLEQINAPDWAERVHDYLDQPGGGVE